MTRRIILALVLVVFAMSPLLAFAQDSDGRIDVIEVSGPLDQRMIDFLYETIDASDALLVVLQVDAPGISSGDPSALFALVEEPPVPVVAWVGPRPARAYGGVAQLVQRVALSGAAPGVDIGYLASRIVTDEVGDGAGLDGGTRVVDEPIIDVIDIVTPTLGQFIVELDERPLVTDAGAVSVKTATLSTDADGQTVLTAALNVNFVKADLYTRFLRLASTPEAAFFFLVIGLAAIAFEYYAAGIGIAAVVGAICLFLAGYGMTTMPLHWGAVTAVIVGLGFYTSDFQRNQLGPLSVAGTALLVGGGVFFTDTRPLYSPKIWAVMLTVITVVLFYSFALTTVVRSRFSTRTIGREHLVGRTGVAESVFEPFGVVLVDGARWRAKAPRAADLAPGVDIEVLDVSGIMLEVAPLDPEAAQRG